jgi:hypothetical protein
MVEVAKAPAARARTEAAEKRILLVVGWLGINMYLLNRKISTRSEIMNWGGSKEGRESQGEKERM